MKRTLDSKRILKQALGKLAKTYTLGYVELSDEQIASLIESPTDANEVENTLYDNYVSEQRWYALREIILPELVPDRVEREFLTDDDDAMDTLWEAILERDDSTVLDDLLRNTGSKLWRYDLGVSILDRSIESVRALAEAAGIDYAANLEALTLLVNETGEGDAWVIWYGDTGRVVQPALNHHWQNADAPGAITWTDPHIVVLNSASGSGHDEQVRGTITLPFDPERLALDSKRGYYGWDDVASVYKPAYECKFQFLTRDEVRTDTVAGLVSVLDGCR